MEGQFRLPRIEELIQGLDEAYQQDHLRSYAHVAKHRAKHLSGHEPSGAFGALVSFLATAQCTKPGGKRKREWGSAPPHTMVVFDGWAPRVRLIHGTIGHDRFLVQRFAVKALGGPGHGDRPGMEERKGSKRKGACLSSLSPAHSKSSLSTWKFSPGPREQAQGAV